jgi:uncharacterized protein
MKKVVFLLMFCLPVWMSVFSKTKQESIKELFHLMGQDSTIDEMFNSVVPILSNQIQGQIKDSTERASSEEVMKSAMQTITNTYKKMMGEDMVALYDKYFSKEEINDFVVFYKSPSGQKMIKVEPQIGKDLMTIMMQKYMPKMLKDMQTKTEVTEIVDKK